MAYILPALKRPIGDGRVIVKDVLCKEMGTESYVNGWFFNPDMIALTQVCALYKCIVEPQIDKCTRVMDYYERGHIGEVWSWCVRSIGMEYMQAGMNEARAIGEFYIFV